VTLASSPGVSHPAAAGPLRPKRRGSAGRSRILVPLAFLAPSVTILAIFVVWPMIDALLTSFTNSMVFGVSQWIGLDNYTKMIADEAFLNALGNTVYYTAVTTPVSIALALGAALLLNQQIPARGFFRAVIFLPFVVSLSIISIAWAFLLDPDVGLVTGWLSAIGIDTGNGVRDPTWAMPAVILVGVWRNVGFFMVMYLAGLQSIPRELYEAAVVDGTSAMQRFRYVTWPMLANTTMFVFIIAAIFSFQAFDQIYVMTNGGPFFVTETLVMLIYRIGFQQFQMGYASAISWALVMIVLAFSLLQMWYFNRRVVRL
jgi:multiple sugar transport system permease protein